MIRYTDLVGQKFGRLTVIEKAPSIITPKGKKQIAWKVICDCGTEKIVRGCDLKNGHTISCGCYNREKDLGKKQYTDLAGKKFGRLTVVEYAYTKNKRAYWSCICDCGNAGIYNGKYLCSGDTQSCGCQKRDSAGMNFAVDLLGKRFGRLTVTGLSQKKPTKWHCICDCGNEVDVRTNCLISGKTKSCGCYQKECRSVLSFKDISGQKFGKLTAIMPVYNLNQTYYWLCKCDCGKEIVVMGHSLRSGNTKSCGCVLSGIEETIASLLTKHNIEFVRQKTFVGCNDRARLKFDFYLPNHNLAIEYDGEMHYRVTTLGNDLEGQQRRDAIKTKYCEENDIVLLRIPYWEKDKIESILSEWLDIDCAEEANSSSADLSA